jgi:cell wall-associated NlpC family hydrolase
VTAAALGAAFAVVPSASAANPITDAKQQAAALAQSVSELQTKAEVVIERYDRAEAALLQANVEQQQADDALNAIQARAAAARQLATQRIQALYESGGDPVVLASLLSGSDPVNAIDRYRLAASVITYEAQNATQAASTVATAQALDNRDASITSRVLNLENAAQNAARQVEDLLAQQRSELATANATVLRLERADEAAQAAQGAADFASAVAAAGGTVGSGEGQPPNATVATAIRWAKSRLGDPYVWGATGPGEFDCSGLTQWAYAHAGIMLPRVAADQYNVGPHPSLADLEPGDLLFWATDISDPATIHHVTIYLGGGLMIAAPHTGTDVQIQPVYMQGFIGATRPWS